MTCTNLPPRTGQQFSISHGDYHAVVTEWGATLRKLTYQGEDIIGSPGPDDMVTCCHGQLRQTAHESAADAEDVNVHDVGCG